MRHRLFSNVLLIVILLKASTLCAQVIPVVVKKNGAGEFRLFRDGKEYYVKGGGGEEHWEDLVSIGGNSVRTWNTDNAKQVLDNAQQLGLTVMLGMWMQHERHGFDYDDTAKVHSQLERFRKVVLEVKDHPALLMWGVGNEVDLFYTNTHVWKAVNDVAQMIHDIDPNHPTCTVTAGLDEEEVKLIKRDAPAIDIYGINTYGDLENVKNNLRRFGWDGPYIITEWGPNGHWEVDKTNWAAPIEQSSSEKAIVYEERYKEGILADKAHCIGSYVFLWGQKQETTSTWYGLFSQNGMRSQAIDVLADEWSSDKDRNKAPIVDQLRFVAKSNREAIILSMDSLYDVNVMVSDPDKDKLKGYWFVIPESTDIREGGDAEAAPEPIGGLFRKRGLDHAKFKCPEIPGSYRIFYFVFDQKGHYGYANLPFYVLSDEQAHRPAKFVRIKTQTMP